MKMEELLQKLDATKNVEVITEKNGDTIQLVFRGAFTQSENIQMAWLLESYRTRLLNFAEELKEGDSAKIKEFAEQHQEVLNIVNKNLTSLTISQKALGLSNDIEPLTFSVGGRGFTEVVERLFSDIDFTSVILALYLQKLYARNEAKGELLKKSANMPNSKNPTMKQKTNH